MTRKQLLIIVAGVVVVLLVIFICPVFFPKFCARKGGGCTPVSLQIWGVYDEAGVFSDLIKAYEKENKCAKIYYEMKSATDYEEVLKNAFVLGKGPDIFLIHNTWLPKYKDIIKEAPETILPFNTFRDTFVDVVEKDLTEDNKIYGLPLYVDTLALYYNKDYLNSAGISSPPETWDDLINDLDKLTKKNQWGAIERAGIALGTAENINRSTDILALLMLQDGTTMVSEDKKSVSFNEGILLKNETYYPGQDALRFYTEFANPSQRTYTWNKQMPYSIDAFVEGKTAMMINYSHHIPTIESRNPYLNFAIGPMPQLETREYDINYANYWAFTVSNKTTLTVSDEAWKFILYLTNQENAKKYLEKAKRPTSRRDLVDWQKDDLELGVFAKQSLSARSWYQIDNNKIETILAEVIDSVVLGKATVRRALDTATAQVNLLMKKE